MEFKVVSVNVIPEHWREIKVLAASEGLSTSAWIRTVMIRAIRQAKKQECYASKS